MLVLQGINTLNVTLTANRTSVVIDHTKVQANQVNYQLWLPLSHFPWIINPAKIAVTLADGLTQCFVEISGNSLWVLVPAVSASVDTPLFIYYDPNQPDNTTYVGATGSIPSQRVWANGFTGVYHFTEIGAGIVGEYKNSTGRGNNGTAQNVVTKGAPTRTPGPCGFAQNFNGNGQFIAIPDSDDFSQPTTGNLVMDFWVAYNTIQNPTAEGNDGVHFLEKGKSGNYEWAWVKHNQQDVESFNGRTSFYIWNLSGGQGAGHYFTPTEVIVVVEWVHCTGKLIRSTGTNGLLSTYKNGVLMHSRYWQDSSYNVVPGNGTSPVWIGTRDGGATPEWFDGKIAELRFSNVDRSNAWIALDYANMRDNLVKYG